MKIVFASTPGQENKVEELVQYFYSTIFPNFFHDDQIKQFEREKVLKPTCNFDGFDTLRDAYQVIACLQTIISILEANETQYEYKAIFDKNASMLTEMGLHFPFKFSQFHHARGMKIEMLSIYSQPANQYLI
ncbi:YhcU family protein [Bacillus marasmi]|uniref:YhcU family protein n=1 Tax=Bacillus marasmi TaxID=1926279 RepID=UPI0011CC95DE|nr:YhcU family protein [Bacillus marasmi]